VYRSANISAALTASSSCRLDDDLAAVSGGEGVELGLVVLSASGDLGVADGDAVVEIGGGRHADARPETP
jgi:hypothetical protein